MGLVNVSGKEKVSLADRKRQKKRCALDLIKIDSKDVGSYLHAKELNERYFLALQPETIPMS
jgi:hypothetical protein